MDPAQGETGGGKSLTSKLMSKVPHSRMKDKVRGLKNRLPGMKKHSGEEDGQEDSSEYDESSPRESGAEMDSNVADSSPFDSGKATADSSSPTLAPREMPHSDSDSSPAQTGYDSRSTDDVATPPPTSSAPVANNLMEEKFQNLSVGENPTPKPVDADIPSTDRGVQPEQHVGVGEDPTSPPVDADPATSDLGDQPKQRLGVEENASSSPVDADSAVVDRDVQPGKQLDAEENPTSPPVDADSAVVDRDVQPDKQLDAEENPTSPPVDADPAMTHDDVKSEQQSASTAESVEEEDKEASIPATENTNEGMLEKSKDAVAGETAAAVLKEKMGDSNEQSPDDPNTPSMLEKAKETLGVGKPSDPNAPPLTETAKTYMGMAQEKLGEITATAADQAASTKDQVAAQVSSANQDKAPGTGKDPNAPPLADTAKAYVGVAQEKMREFTATAADQAASTKDQVATQATPAHQDKALSEQVTDNLSTLPGVLREKMFGPTSPSPASSSPTTPSSPGIMNRVSGAVSSLFTSAPKDTTAEKPQTAPAPAEASAGASTP